MKKLIFLLFFLASCSCLPARFSFPGGTRGDREVEYVQSLMQSTVYIHQKILLEPVDVMTPFGPIKTQPSTDYNATGVVLDVRNGQSLVLTVKHICDSDEASESKDPELKDKKVVGWKYLVTNLIGETEEAQVLVRDSARDFCVLKMNGVMGAPARVAQLPPPIGARLFNVGSPADTHGKFSFYVAEGLFGGEQEVSGVRRMLVSVPVTGGSSGSPLFYGDELVGIVWGVNTGFHHIAWINPIDLGKPLIQEALRQWNP